MAKHEEVKKYIKIRKASEHNLKGIDIDIPRDEFVVLTDLAVRESHLLHLIQSMRRDREDIWSLCLLMPDNFWGLWKNLMSRR